MEDDSVSKKDEASSGLADKQLTLNKPIFRVIFVHPRNNF